MATCHATIRCRTTSVCALAKETLPSVGDAAATRRRSSHVVRRVLCHRGRRYCRRRPAVQESCRGAPFCVRRRCRRRPPMQESCRIASSVPPWPSVMPPSPGNAGVVSCCECRPTLSVGDAAVARGCRSHVAQRVLCHRGRR